MKTPPNTPVWFRAWPEALRQLRLPAIRNEQYRLALIRYLRFSKETRQQASVEPARAAGPTRVSVVLSRDECRQLFDALGGQFAVDGRPGRAVAVRWMRCRGRQAAPAAVASHFWSWTISLKRDRLDAGMVIGARGAGFFAMA
jgi:hypothetical protein